MGTKKKILVTGSNGFLGRNLIDLLKDRAFFLTFDKTNSLEELSDMVEQADFVFHFAAIQRPVHGEAYSDNIELTECLLHLMEKRKEPIDIFFSSSIQAERENGYGRAKRAEEDRIRDYSKKTGARSYICRFPNLFGRFSRPNYTSVISTFCYNAITGAPLLVSDPSAEISFCFVEDALTQILQAIDNGTFKEPFSFERVSEVSLGELVYYIGRLKAGCAFKPINSDHAWFCSRLALVYDWFKNECVGC